MGMKIEVTTTYDMNSFPAFDEAVNHAAGRASDFSGAGLGRRDMGWVCRSDLEAHKIARALEKIGLTAKVSSPER